MYWTTKARLRFQELGRYCIALMEDDETFFSGRIGDTGHVSSGRAHFSFILIFHQLLDVITWKYLGN